VNVERSSSGDVTVLKLIGRLDVPGSQVALDGVLTAQTAGAKVVLDMSECNYVASSGLRTLLIAAKQAGRSAGKIALAAPQPLVVDIITMAGFNEVIDSYPTVPDAITALN